MTVQELIEALQKIENKTAKVFIWNDGSRLEIDEKMPTDEIEDEWQGETHTYVDINTVN